MAEKRKILIVDDDPHMAELLADFCGDLGLETKVLTDSRAAAQEALSWRPDLVTLDLEMPYKDGMEVLKEIRSHESLATTPVIIISCLAKDVSMAAGAVQGIYAKPVNFKALTGSLDALLRNRAAAV
jgi:DNA-binding response OmpR family regulator